ncbi:MAG: hypothetical protein LBQ96_06805 [Fusobacteriaceae bacterium]|jgi:hypothetical protein|nr:hypothetical protein [Fusobacteriaceae bacterium]
MKKLCCMLLLLAGSMLSGREIRDSELEFRNGLFYKKWETVPYTGAVREPAGRGSSEFFCNVRDGLIEDFVLREESGKPTGKGRFEGKNFYFDAMIYFPAGGLRNEVNGIVEGKNDQDMQRLIMESFRKDPDLSELTRILMTQGKMDLKYKEFGQADSNKTLADFHMIVEDGLMTGEGTGGNEDGSGQNYKMTLRFGDLRKIDFSAFSNPITNPFDMAASGGAQDLNRALAEVAKLEEGEFVMQLLDAAGTKVGDAAIRIKSGVLDGELDLQGGQKFQLRFGVEKVNELDANRLYGLKGNPDGMVIVETAIREAAKLEKITLKTAVEQPQINAEIELTCRKGQLEAKINEYKPAGKIRQELILQIDDVTKINVREVNTKDPFSLVKALRLSGTYRDFDENGQEKSRMRWDGNDFLGVVMKIGEYMR